MHEERQVPGGDLTSAAMASPPAPPLTVTSMTPGSLSRLGDLVAERTWTAGLRSWFWGEGVCLLGLVRLAQARREPFPPRVLAWLDEHAGEAAAIDHVNNLAPGTAAVLAHTDPTVAEDRYLQMVEPLATWALTNPSATRAPGGALEHWPGGVWADTTFMAGLFLGHLGFATRRLDLLAELGAQVLAHAAILQDRDTGLFAHGSHRGETIWCFWGRGNAWCALSAVEFLELADKVGDADLDIAAMVPRVADVLAHQLLALTSRQPEHGMWSVLVDDQPENAGIVEASATAGLGAALLRAQAVLPGLPDQTRTAGWRAVRAALGQIAPDGTLTRVSAGTVLQLVPFGYSVIRDDRIQPWGQGLALHAIAAALDALERGETPR